MKNSWLPLVLGLLFSVSATAEPAKSKMLVQDLTPQGVAPHEALALSTAACTAFSKSRKHDVLCGDDLRQMIRFGALAASFDGCADETCYTNVGKALKARYVVSGNVTKLGKIYVLSLSMFDTKDGRPVGRTEVKANSIESLHEQVGEASSAILTGR